MSPRVYVRKFDWDEARARYAAGEPVNTLAAEYGVTRQAVYRVVTPGCIEREAAYSRERQRRGRCNDCGGPMNLMSRSRGSTRCVACAAAARVTSVRDGEIRCFSCHAWKPDDDFPRSASQRHLVRRGRHSFCRACQTIKKREYRHRNSEKQRAYDRAYKARRRAAKRASA